MEANPFEVSLSNTSVNFGEVRLGKTVSRMFTINNHSELPTKFEFFNQPGNVFSFSKTKGQIQPLSNIRILVYFSPLHTVSYYERIFCIVKNHQILYIDLLGTCYDLLEKPLAIQQSHVDLFRKRVIEGRLTKIDFKYLENSLQNCPQYETYKQSIRLREQTEYEES